MITCTVCFDVNIQEQQSARMEKLSPVFHNSSVRLCRLPTCAPCPASLSVERAKCLPSPAPARRGLRELPAKPSQPPAPAQGRWVQSYNRRWRSLIPRAARSLPEEIERASERARERQKRRDGGRREYGDGSSSGESPGSNRPYTGRHEAYARGGAGHVSWGSRDGTAPKNRRRAADMTWRAADGSKRRNR
ncbi:unnamed protein product [Lampetra planeri]